MQETSKTWINFVYTVTCLFFSCAFRVSCTDVSDTWLGNTYLCGNKTGLPSTYNYNEEICCHGIHPKYKDIWEQKCCEDVKKPYSFGLELCCENGIKKNIPGIQSDAICSGITADISGNKKKDVACQQKYAKHFLFCESTRKCYDTKKKTCCPDSQQLYDTPSSEGNCCEQEIFNLKDNLPCHSPKQNYVFCQPKLRRRQSIKERKTQLEKICKSPHIYMIKTDKMELRNKRNLYFTANVSQLVDQGFQQSIGNTTRHSIVLDIWMPSKCKSILERYTFLVLSMTPPKRFIRDLLYINEKTDIIYNKYNTSQYSLDRIFQDVREIKERCLLERRNSAHSKRKEVKDKNRKTRTNF